jgi:competence protein ComEC
VFYKRIELQPVIGEAMKNSGDGERFGDKASAVKSLAQGWGGFKSLSVKFADLTGELPPKISANKLPLMLRLQVLYTATSDAITRTFELERASGTFFHFAPLIFGMGISIYFLVPAEPLLTVLLVTFGLLTLAAVSMIDHGRGWLMICAGAIFVGGMCAGKIRTEIVNTHPLATRITGQITGIIIEVSRNQRGSARYLIKPQKIEGVNDHQLPTTIRVSAASKHLLGRPGDSIRGLARLQPVSGPAYPGSFDFSFNSWYNGLGAAGFFMGAPKTAISDADSSRLPSLNLLLPTRFSIFINNLRSAISARIRAALPDESGDIGVALIVGDRTGIDRGTQESLRSSGLAHVLAISGMHMALVSLTMIWVVRFLLALNMRLATTKPIKNWASIAGFITASSYLAISGMGVATQRAWIMISVMMLAAILSRKSITLRGVAVAALVLMVLQPESILSPRFQMSFAAVAAIVAAYERLDQRKRRKAELPRANRVVRFFATLVFTSLIAGLATSLFAAYHFHRVAPFGVLTNLLAMPLVSTIVMPMALLSVLAMPFGLEQLALVPMGLGIEWVVGVSDYVNAFDGNGITGKLGTPVLPMAFVGLFMLTMLKTALRISGAVLLMATALFWSGSSTPDILLSEDGRAIAVKDSQNKLAMLYPRRNKFVRDIWLRAFSDDEMGKVQGRGVCNKDICTATTQQGALVYLVYDPDLLPLACNRADILLAPRLRWVNCRERKPSLIIKRGQLEEFGAHAIYLEANGPVISASDDSSSNPAVLETHS